MCVCVCVCVCAVQLLSRFFACCTFIYAPLPVFYWYTGERQNLELSSFTAANLKEESPALWLTVLATIFIFGAPNHQPPNATLLMCLHSSCEQAHG